MGSSPLVKAAHHLDKNNIKKQSLLYNKYENVIINMQYQWSINGQVQIDFCVHLSYSEEELSPGGAVRSSQ